MHICVHTHHNSKQGRLTAFRVGCSVSGECTCTHSERRLGTLLGVIEEVTGSVKGRLAVQTKTSSDFVQKIANALLDAKSEPTPIYSYLSKYPNLKAFIEIMFTDDMAWSLLQQVTDIAINVARYCHKCSNRSWAYTGKKLFSLMRGVPTPGLYFGHSMPPTLPKRANIKYIYKNIVIYIFQILQKI